MKKYSGFQKWWLSRNEIELDFAFLCPHDVAKVAFEAGVKSVPAAPELRRAAENLLDMLSEFDAGFDGHGEVVAMEKLLGRPISKTK